jgi:hypothetical protein
MSRRYIDADKLKEECYKFANDVSRSAMAFVQGRINAAPTADVVAVVRCQDCKYFVDEDETDMLGLCTCKRIAIAYNGELYPERDFYCAYGERREE